MLFTIAPMVKPEVADAPYFIKILDKLKKKLNDEYHFIISRSNNDDEKNILKNCINKSKKNILILLSDENGIIPPFLDEFFLVFRTYSNKNLYDNKKIFPVPCGFSFGFGGFFGNSDWKYDDAEKNKKPLIYRNYDIFYSGQISENRLECINALDRIKDKFKTVINVTNGFARGYKLEDYYNYMSNSKISIVPEGVAVPESFRYFESFENNCIVVTTYPKKNDVYNNWFYNDSPAIFLNNWSEFNTEIVKNLLTENNLIEYEKNNRYYFEKNISTDAISNYILEKIKNYENNI